MGIVTLFKQSYSMLLQGLEMTMFLSVVSIAIAIVIGIVVGLINISKGKHNVFRVICGAYIDIIRGTPLIVQAFFIYFGLPVVVQAIGSKFGIVGLSTFKINVILAGIIATSLNAGAYMSEIFRGGILAVDSGQMEAARSLGIPYKKAMITVVLPQAVRKMIPSLVNQFIISLKDTSILSVIGIQELTGNGQIIMASTYAAFQTWLFVGIIYFVIIKIITIAARKVEERLTI